MQKRSCKSNLPRTSGNFFRTPTSLRDVVSYCALFTAGWFGVREKHCFRLEIYDRLRANEQAASARNISREKKNLNYVLCAACELLMHVHQKNQINQYPITCQKWIFFLWFLIFLLANWTCFSLLGHHYEVHQIWAMIIIIDNLFSCSARNIWERSGSTILIRAMLKGQFEMARLRTWRWRSRVGIWSA